MMFRSVLTKTMYDARRLMLFWGLGVFGLVFMYASMYPSFAGSNDLVKVMNSLPEAVRDMIGGVNAYATAHGYIGAEWFSLSFPLLLGILGITLGSALLTREEESRTMELLLARPVSRARIVRQKTLAMLAEMAAIGLAGWLAVVLGSLVIEKFSLNLGFALEATVAGILLAWCFALLALAVTGLVGLRSLAAGVTALVFGASYLVSTFAQRVDWLEPVRVLSLFEHYKPTEALASGWKPMDAVVLLAVSAVCYAIAEFGFRRRDTGR